MKNKKILLISHNPLSQVNNNGKTLVSIFQGIPSGNIYQIYLNSDIPDYDGDCHYLQLNEKQIIRSIFSRKNVCCQEINSTTKQVSSATIRIGSFGIHTKRLLRECIWKVTLWESKLRDWLEDKEFDVVFFMAGDGIFAYDVYRFVMMHSSAKGCLFFTDDYILGKNSYSPVALLRQNLLKRKIKKTLLETKELYVISDEMREAYKKLFNMEGHVIRNFSVERISEDINDSPENFNRLVMVYAGGLHYNRWRVLSQIADTLKILNQSGKVECFLEIYSSQNISKEIINQISVEGASAFMGGVSAAQIAEVYAHADILVHVESFEKKAIASTKYSFSTKIPEYLSAGKCILAVGPLEVASIRYLQKVAYVLDNSADFSFELSKIINDRGHRESIKVRCMEQYEKDFSRKKQKECLEQILSV